MSESNSTGEKTKPARKAAKSTKPTQKTAKPTTKSSSTKTNSAPAKATKTERPTNRKTPTKTRKIATRQQPKANMAIARTVDDLRKATADIRKKSAHTIALVPTMGALHDGHMRLIDKAHDEASHVAASIFVNPAQFAPTEDLATYPRDEETDLEKLRKARVALVWCPSPEVMYPDGFSSAIQPPSAASGLETDHRPHFFQGVTTVVAKLFNQVRPDKALFGEKDYQQLCVIKAMVKDLDLGIEIIGVPTFREDDGLALSSRNAYLNDKQRSIAPSLYDTLQLVAQKVKDGADPSRAKADGTMHLLSNGFRRVDYIDIRDAETLAPFNPARHKSGRILGAAWLGQTRLIDNIPL